MNLSSSTASVVSCYSADDASPAIRPITVESAVLITIPIPFPAVHIVPKNATFGDSKMFGSHLFLQLYFWFLGAIFQNLV